MTDSEWFCRWDAFATTFSVGVSINFLACISLDKCLTLKYPLHYKSSMTRKKAIQVAATIWISMFLLFLPMLAPLPWMRPKFYEGSDCCTIDWAYNHTYTYILIILIFLQFIPSSVIFISFITMWIVIHKRSDKTSRSTLSHDDSNHNLYTTKMLLLMTLGFYIMSTP